MVSFDRRLQKILVRAVYDGPACAGKTTNLQQLASSFTSLRRGPLLNTGDKDGRTLFFDWLHLDGGVIAGHPLRCEFVTVPGQFVLANRRWHLVRTADVLVFVCDSSSRGVREAKRAFELLRARLCDMDRPPPIVLQANKQDASDAMPPDDVAAALDAGPEIVTIGARAAFGLGVRETAAHAIRAAADLAQQLVIERGLDALQDPLDDPESLLATMKNLDPRPQGRFTLAPALSLDSSDTPPPRRAESATVTAPAPPVDDSPLGPLSSDARATPPLPAPDLPTRFLWPAATGRDTLRAIDELRRTLPMDRRAARHGTVRLRLGGFDLETSRRHHFREVKDALSALVALARSTVRLGRLAPQGIVLAITPVEDGSYWLWTIAPAMTSFAELLRGAPRDEAVDAFAQASADLLCFAFHQGLSLQIDPERVAFGKTDVGYLGHDVDTGEDLAATVGSMLRALSEFALSPAEEASFARGLARGITSARPVLDELRKQLPRSATAGLDERTRRLATLVSDALSEAPSTSQEERRNEND